MLIFVHILIHVLVHMSRYIMSFTTLGPIFLLPWVQVFFIYMVTYCSPFFFFSSLILLSFSFSGLFYFALTHS